MEIIKRQYLLIVVLLSTLQLSAQINFYKTYDGSAFDRGESITQLPDSSYAVTGGSGAFSLNSGQAFLMLTDSSGNHQWTKSYGGNGSDWGRRVFHRPGIGFTIAGTTNSTSDGRYNFYAITTDESGNLQTEKNFGTPNWEQLWDAVQLSDGGLIMVGETEGENSAKKDMYIARIDDVGDTVWTKTISTPENDVAKAVEILNDTTVIIGGYKWDGAKTNAILMSLHINGTENWNSFYPGSVDESKISDISIYNGEVFCAGELVLPGQENIDWWLWKTDDQGNDIDELVGDFDRYDGLKSLCVVNDNVYIGLESNSDYYNVFQEGVDAFVLKFHTDLWFNNFTQSYSGVNSDLLNDMIATVDEGVAIAGTCGQDRTTPTLSTSVMLIKIGPNDETPSIADQGNDLVNVSKETFKEEFVVYPNPTSGVLQIDGLSGDYSVALYSSLGRCLLNQANGSKVDISDLKDGVYLLHITKEEGTIVQRIVKR